MNQLSDLYLEYTGFYQRFLWKQWYGMGPREYVIVLTVVALIGYYGMRSALRR